MAGEYYKLAQMRTQHTDCQISLRSSCTGRTGPHFEIADTQTWMKTNIWTIPFDNKHTIMDHLRQTWAELLWLYWKEKKTLAKKWKINPRILCPGIRGYKDEVRFTWLCFVERHITHTRCQENLSPINPKPQKNLMDMPLRRLHKNLYNKHQRPCFFLKQEMTPYCI